jgi:hypothetical protein
MQLMCVSVLSTCIPTEVRGRPNSGPEVQRGIQMLEALIIPYRYRLIKHY